MKLIGDEFASIIPIGPHAEAADEARIAKREAEVAAWHAAREADLAAARTPRVPLTEFGWPARALEVAATADVTRQACALLAAHDFKSRNVVVLSGAPGCGKTVAAARWALRRTPRPRFVRASTFAAGSRYDAEQRAQWFGAPALVLDDLGAEYLDAKGSFMTDLDELVDTFYGDLRPLVITSNCTLASFKTRYGERVVDRLRECAAFIAIAAPSMRSSS